MYSSMRLSPSTLMGKDQVRKIKTIIQNITDKNQSAAFLTPVDWKALNLSDYTFIIKNPMDLGTIGNKLKEEKYRYVEEALDDIQLVWDNCKTYNRADTWIYKEAETLERHFKKMVKNYLPSIPITVPGRQNPGQPEKKPNTNPNLFQEDNAEEVSYHQKMKFSQKLKHISGEDLGQLMTFIVERCPSAFHEENDHAQLFVDNIDALTFSDANELLKSFNDQFEEEKRTKKKQI